MPALSKAKIGVENDSSSQNVTVCVRVRPLNDRFYYRCDLPARLNHLPHREKKLHSPCSVSMDGNQTTIDNLTGRPHSFFYDHSFCSYDRDVPTYASQELIFEKIGLPLVDRCMEGYNCCLFAYGQVSFLLYSCVIIFIWILFDCILAPASHTGTKYHRTLTGFTSHPLGISA